MTKRGLRWADYEGGGEERLGRGAIKDYGIVCLTEQQKTMMVIILVERNARPTNMQNMRVYLF